MFALFFTLLPFLQGMSALVTIWGFAHAAPVTEAVVTYGASGPDAPDMMAWMNSYGSMLFGVLSFAASHYFAKVTGANAEMMASLLALIKTPKDGATERRFAFAMIDWIEAAYIASHPTISADQRAGLEYVINWLRTEFAVPKSSTIVAPAVVAATTAV